MLIINVDKTTYSKCPRFVLLDVLIVIF